MLLTERLQNVSQRIIRLIDEEKVRTGISPILITLDGSDNIHFNTVFEDSLVAVVTNNPLKHYVFITQNEIRFIGTHDQELADEQKTAILKKIEHSLQEFLAFLVIGLRLD